MSVSCALQDAGKFKMSKVSLSLVLIGAILGSVSVAAEPADPAATKESELAREKATAVCDAKQAADDAKRALDAAVADYAKFRQSHRHIALSKESEMFVKTADAVLGLQGDAGVQRAVSAAEKEKQDKERADETLKNLLDEKRDVLQRRLVLSQIRVTVARRAWQAAQDTTIAIRDAARTDESTSDERIALARHHEQACDHEYQEALIGLAVAERQQREFETLALNETSKMTPPQKDPEPEPTITAPATGTAGQDASGQPSKVMAVFELKDGTKLEVLSSLDSDDVYVVKTASGVQTIRKDDIYKIRRKR
jgi:hypothetical protein